MEYIEIRFVHVRKVFIDGDENGVTNEPLRIGAGTHLFDLGAPKDYTPAEIIKSISGTTALNPAIIEFNEV